MWASINQFNLSDKSINYDESGLLRHVKQLTTYKMCRWLGWELGLPRSVLGGGLGGIVLF